MSNGEKYRALARECMRRAERARSIERREALLDMATGWAEAAAQVDHQVALIDRFDESVRKARDNLRVATDGRGPIVQANGSGQTEQTNDHRETTQQFGERGDAPAE
jgi:hypothetical protein